MPNKYYTIRKIKQMAQNERKQVTKWLVEKVSRNYKSYTKAITKSKSCSNFMVK